MFLAMFTSASFLFSMYGSEIVNRSYNRAKSIIILGFTGNFFLIILPIFNNPVYYITCIVFRAITDSLLLSIWNIAFKHNYTPSNRSKLFSYVTTLQISVLLVTTTFFGHYLDLNLYLYKIMFPVAGLCGMITYYYLSKMISLSMDDYKGRTHNIKSHFTLQDYKEILVFPGKDLIRILKNNKAFLRFEVYFFLYGMAFMILLPVVPVFLVDDLRLSYSPISFAKGLVFHLTLIIFTPIMGRYHGKGNPSKFCGFVFIILALYPIVMLSAKYIVLNTEIIIYFSHFFYGLAMSGVSIAWALSSIYYAPAREVSSYQAAHITLTGVRGLFSPALGYAVMQIFAIEFAFLLSALLFFLAGILMLREAKRPKLLT